MKLKVLKKVVFATTMIFSLMLSFSSCDKRFEKLNTDPNQSSSTSTAFLLTNAQKSMMDLTWDEWFNGRRGNQLAQYWSSNQYSDESRYQFSVNITNAYWREFYTIPLLDLQEIINLNSGDAAENYTRFGANANQIAIAQILQVWLYQNITDCWGPVPYTQALNVKKYPLPAYDDQKTIYNGLLSTLDAAIGAIDETDDHLTGDVIYNGNMSQWKKFANSLKMRVALRMADADETVAKAAFEAAATHGFTSNADNALFTYLNSQPNINPQAKDYINRNDFAASNTMVDELLRLNDPRIEFYYAPAASSGMYVGEVYGLTETDAALTSDMDISQRSTTVLANDFPGIFLDYAQVCFMLSEAAARGWAITADAKTHYEEGIRASMNFWVNENITYSDIQNYIESSYVNYDSLSARGESWQQIIGRQKWIALYMQGIQGWTEWRRLDFGILQPPAAGVLNGSAIPNRMEYPLEEQTLNGRSYTAGVAILGGADNQDTKLWWDVN